MIKHDKYLQKVVKAIEKKTGYKIELNVVGSYRRECKNSGDIDVLITDKSDSKEERTKCFGIFIKTLRKIGYLQADLAVGTKKYMGVVKLKGDSKARRLDILITSREEYPFALLYFTGSMEMNVEMRKRAIELGYNLNEYSFKRLVNGAKELPDHKIFKTEEDIFNFLGYKYIEPKKRDGKSLEML